MDRSRLPTGLPDTREDEARAHRQAMQRAWLRVVVLGAVHNAWFRRAAGAKSQVLLRRWMTATHRITSAWRMMKKWRMLVAAR